MFSNLRISMERINFQIDRAFFHELTAICKTAVDAVREIRGGRIDALTTDYADAVFNTLTRIDFSTKLSECITKHTGLKYVVAGKNDPHDFAYGGVWCNFKYKDTFMHWEAQSGVFQPNYHDPVGDFLNLVQKLDGKTDVDTGYHTHTKLGKKQEYTGFVVYGTRMFCLAETSTAVEPMTADEVASIILHEVGHAITFLDQIGNTYYHSEDIAYYLKYLSNDLKPTQVPDLVKAVQGYIATRPDAKSGKWSELTQVLGNLVASPLVAVGTVVAAMYGLFTAGIVGQIKERANWSLDRKQSDILETRLNGFYSERVADEYASRMGAAKSLLSALKKFEQSRMLARHDRDDDSPIVNMAKATGVMKQYQIISAIFSPPLSFGYQTYDYEWNRLRKALEDGYMAFQSEDIPASFRDDMIADIKEMKKMLAEFESIPYVKARKFFWGTLIKLTSPDKITETFKDGNLHADYMRLQEATGYLFKNPLNYQSARLQSILDKTAS